MRPYGMATVYTITRQVETEAGLVVWGRPTGLCESAAAAREYANTQLSAVRQAGQPFTRPDEARLMRAVQRRFGLSEASAAAAVAAALHETAGAPQEAVA